MHVTKMRSLRKKKGKGEENLLSRDGRAAYQRVTKDRQAVQAASVHF